MQIKIIAEQLLAWYLVNKRILPFRGTKNPYKIWISEVMLQQTQVKTVIPYYSRWIKHLPSLNAVANSESDSLLKFWEGLGYYRRCLNFHKSAKIVQTEFDGKIPSDYNTFMTLPGVGSYTAGAVLSIAYGYKVPAVDVNVTRVISRIHCKQNINNHIIQNTVQRMLEFVLESGDLNQSLMELGALICKPKNPDCGNCPISDYCKSFANKKILKYPHSIKVKPKPHYNVVVGMIWRGERFFIQKRKTDSMLAGLWEFPGGKVKNGENLKNALIRKLKEECGFHPKIIRKVDSIKHSYSHFSILLHCFLCFEEEIKLMNNSINKWIKPEEIKKFSFPKANHKLFKLMSENDWNI